MNGNAEAPDMASMIDEARDLVSFLSSRWVSLRWVANNRPEVFGPALFLFGIRHRDGIRREPSLLPSEGWGLAMVVPAADRLRAHFGAEMGPLDNGVTWPRHIYLEIDRAVSALWYLRAGMTVPAALIARTMLERWTLNVAHRFETDRLDGEEDQAFISRVWSLYDHETIPREAGEWWAWLSELLHGRPGTSIFGDRCAVPITADMESTFALHVAIVRILELSMRQIRGALTTLAESEGMTDTISAFQALPPQGIEASEPFPMTDAFLPLDYYQVHLERSELLLALASLYRKRVMGDAEKITTRFSSAMAVGALFERRGRAVERARAAFEYEKSVLGDAFNPGLLASKMFRFISIAQLARMLATQAHGYERDALLTAAQAVDGAAHLWLEDSDDAMGCVRVLLEQTARLRVHRVKKTRALKLERRSRTSASRWLSDAGWGRLAVLMKAVNEFSHLGVNTRRSGARRVLAILQSDEQSPETGRGSALLSVVYMFAFEMHARLADEPAIASSFTETVTLLNEADHVAELEAYLRNAHLWRDEEFGEPDLISREEHERREQAGLVSEP